MPHIRNRSAPSTFLGKFERISNGYPTYFSKLNCKRPKAKFNAEHLVLKTLDLKVFSS